LNLTKIKESRNLYKIIVLVILFSYSIGILYLLRFNPDPQHDGILLSAGSATSKGLIPHQDYIFIWGPLLPYILSIPAHIGDNLFNLRVFGYLCFLLTTFFAYLINKKLFSKNQAKLISITWLISFPAFSMYSAAKWPLPSPVWPNIYGTLLILIAALILIQLQNKTSGHILLALSSGLFSVLSLFIRLDLITLYFGLLVFMVLKYKNKIELFVFLIPTMVTILIFLFKKSSIFIQAWKQQNFDSVISGGYTSGVPSFTIFGALRALIAITLLSILYFSFVFIFKIIIDKQKKYLYVIASLLIIYLTFCFVYNYKNYSVFPLNKLIVWLNKINSEFSLGFVAVSLVAIIPLTYLNYKNKRLNITDNPNYVLLAILAFCSLQLNHNFNIDYIWINSIFLISYVLLGIHENTKFKVKVLVLPSIIFSCIIFISGIISLQQSQIYNFKYHPLEKMKTNNILYGKELDAELKLINSIPVGSNFQNLCADSLYSVNSRKLVFPTDALVFSDSQLFKENMVEQSGSWIFRCNVAQIQFNSLRSDDLKFFKKSTGHFSVVYKSPNK